MKKDSENLEYERLQYQLRGSFFLRKLGEFLRLKAEIYKISQPNLQWNNLEQMGISKPAWETIKSNKIKPHLVFCHPEIISSKPQLIAYYRLLAVYSQKGVQRLAFGVQDLEDNPKGTLEAKNASILAQLFNQQISSLLEQNPQISLEELHLLAVMNFGTQVNGSWRNEIGNEGSRKVKELLLNFFSKQKLLKDIELLNGDKIGAASISAISIEEIRKMRLKNGYQFVFASEPDVSILDPSDKLEGAIEIKAGLDPAGALERYGAAKKSFDKALAQNKSAITIYLASCITDEVKNRIESDRLVRKEFDLTKILTDAKSRKDFFDYLKWLVHS